MDIVLDGGNARYKWLIPQRNGYGEFRHAFAHLTESQWNKVVSRGNIPEGYARVNGIPFVFGDKARRYTMMERKRGAARYTADYYGVLLAYTLYLSGISPRNINLIASFPPVDVDYIPTLIDVAKQTYTVQGHHTGKECIQSYEVTNVDTIDEPLAGYFHFVLTSDGNERKRNPIANKTVLVLDAGGHTVDCVAVDAGGDIDLSTLDSTRTGTLDMLIAFERDIRTTHKEAFQNADDLDIQRIENALVSGHYDYGKRSLNVRDEADAALSGLCNDIRQIITSNGGIYNYDTILMTGGGSALLIDRLRGMLPDIDILTADEDVKVLQFANVNGGAKLAQLMRRTGIW